MTRNGLACQKMEKEIRAVQGHSTEQVRMQMEEVEPPLQLYHGTATRFLTSILTKGLISGSRHHVHLSGDVETAVKVGKRHGQPVVLKIDTQGMLKNGLSFYRAENGVWLNRSRASGIYTTNVIISFIV
ncbi:RNA 2'-phosphotransferase [Aphelenchoides bicaudatus]|nr:RNA 2'-phosphotransferase [Aphelenchoides bicaudatus]